MTEKASESVVDLSRFEDLIQSQEDGIDFELLDEMGRPIGLTLTMVGPDSKRARKAMKEVAAEFAARAEDRGSLAPAEDDEDERMASYLSKVTTGWAPNPAIGGKSVPFTEENARNFFIRFRMFTEQAQARAVRRAPFVKSSSYASAG
jgi:hypothetical protein